MEQEILKAATVHKVNINVDRMLSASTQTTTILQAPLRGIERYGDDDFLKGAPVVLVVIKSSALHPIPNGSYVVKVEHRPGASSGKALFTMRKEGSWRSGMPSFAPGSRRPSSSQTSIPAAVRWRSPSSPACTSGLKKGAADAFE